ncbi:RNA 2',3'-cyclic phosphodiesterase [Aliifodinibius salipaludis]|uniref:RNA 2',3'-cyclic phosphodiesterase n=1 Tax=Fodinibius salipaludis TaxID=2032627 RepID=A0A2A2G868_9BACT|nr:RNA 2',3'-cyclic phosphodiesterase [Aliifodinibius salipaludis]PAU93360.1 RNA 2',3'-cyclic phosphodiesterase [Aliifodinibius salipaludis]
MRLFIAIPLREGVKRKLLDLRQPIDGMQWQSQEQMHLTLKFVGEVDKTTPSELRGELDNIVHPAFTMTITGIGYFPEGKQPKVVWAGVKENTTLQELHQKVEDHCEKMGIAPENRSYKPHVTIGRTKNTSKRTVTSFINQHKKFAIPDISVSEFVLYESKLHPDGARHYPLQTYSLRSDE